MSRADTWLGASDKAVDHAAIIADKPTSIVLIRAGSPLAAQTVRIEEQHGSRQAQTPAGEVFMIASIVFFYKDHPTIADGNVKPGDRFAIGGVSYEIIAIAPMTVGSIQAYARLRA